MWTEFLNLYTVAVLYEHYDLGREADCFLSFIPQRPVKAFPQHLPLPREIKTSLEISCGSVKSPASAPTQGKQTPLPPPQCYTRDIWTRPSEQNSCVPHSICEQGPSYLSWKFLAAHISNPALFSFPSLMGESSLLDLASHDRENNRSSSQLRFRLYIYFLFLPFLHCSVTCQNEEIVAQSGNQGKSSEPTSHSRWGCTQQRTTPQQSTRTAGRGRQRETTREVISTLAFNKKVEQPLPQRPSSVSKHTLHPCNNAF